MSRWLKPMGGMVAGETGGGGTAAGVSVSMSWAVTIRPLKKTANFLSRYFFDRP